MPTCGVVSFALALLFATLTHPVDRIPDRQRRADRAVRAAGRVADPVPDARRVGAVLPGRVAAAGPAGLRRARRCRSTYAVSLLRGIWQGHPWSAHATDIAALTRSSWSARRCRRRSSAGPSSPWCKSRGIRRALHPGGRRCASFKYRRYSRSARLGRRAHRSSRCDARLAPRTASRRPTNGAALGGELRDAGVLQISWVSRTTRRTRNASGSPVAQDGHDAMRHCAPGAKEVPSKVMKHSDERGADAVALAPPTSCPSCRSTEVKTTSKVVTSEAYWRCEACGEVWNDARRRAADRYSPGRAWGR